MAKDYGYRSRQMEKKGNKKRSFSRDQKRAIPWGAIILLIILLSLLITGLMFLKKGKPMRQTLPSKNKIVTQAKEVTLQKKDNSFSPMKEDESTFPIVNFTFYKVLPKRDVSLWSGQTDKSLTTKISYFLQIATFDHQTEAKELQEKIKLLGLHARVVSITRGGKINYRLQVGYFNDIKSVLSVQNKLATKRISSVVLQKEN